MSAARARTPHSQRRHRRAQPHNRAVAHAGGRRATSLWNSVGFWRAAAAGAATAGATAAGGSRADPSGHAPGARRRQHRLAGQGRSAPVQVLMVPVPAPADAQGRIAELWLIPQGEAPHSLGLVSTQVAHSVPVPADLLAKLVTGATLAISLEPPSGVPHSAPTGPIVAKGGLSL
ncbi:anti-sigma factor domain-containing protein [Lysobacter gummosus]